MSLLAPLGLLGLISLGVLILIYLLKPNYQKKIVSSTFVWKLSLRYRKRNLPVNYFRDILILICQILIFTACAMILARPIISSDSARLRAEKIIIIDGSVSMMTQYDGKTRFQRAVEEAYDLTLESLNDDGVVSVIMATDTPYYVVQRADSTAKSTVKEDLNALLTGQKCAYTSANLDVAMSLAEEILLINPEAGVFYITGTDYIETGSVEVISVSDPKGEWNAAILDCKAEIVEGYYNFNLDVACYNKNDRITVYVDVYDINGTTEKRQFKRDVYCSGDKTVRVSFQSADSDEEGTPIISFSSANAYVKEQDCFGLDNNFTIYGGRKQKIKIQYVTDKSTVFLNGVLSSIRGNLKHKWDIELRKIEAGENASEKVLDSIAYTGYDMYVYENLVPEMLPTDGLVFLVNPSVSIPEIGFEYMGYSFQEQLFVGQPHPVNNGLEQESLKNTILNMVGITNVPEGFDVPLEFNSSSPAVMVKNTPTEKIAIMNMGFAYTDISVIMEFPQVIYNIFEYFIPSTIYSTTMSDNIYLYNIGETITLRSRGETLTVTTPNETIVYDTFPATLKVSAPGTYTLTQVPFARPEEEKIIENVFVRLEKSESNIFRQEDKLIVPIVTKDPDPIEQDLLIYFIAVAVGLLFVEWILKSIEK